jgi:hypothetical protein
MDLDANEFFMQLHTGTYTPSAAHSDRSELTNEVANGQGYVTGGKTLSATTWSTGATSVEMRFDAHSLGTKWSCNGTSISTIRIAVIYNNSTGTSLGNRKLVAYASLSSSNFSVTGGNSLTITPSANGIFELNSV